MAFIPILVDRGVPLGRIQRHIAVVLDREREQILKAIQDPQVLINWIHQQSIENRSSEVMWESGLPILPIEKAIFLL
jgi:hypothetical protein